MMKKALLFVPFAVLLLSGCVTDMQVNVNPANAQLGVVGGPAAKIATVKGKTVVSIPQGETVTLSATLTGYDTVQYQVSAADVKKGSVTLILPPLFLDKTFVVSTTPDGAQVFVDGKPVGTAPGPFVVRFNRKSASAPWDAHKITVSLPEWQSESVALDSSSGADISIPLDRLHLVRTFTIKAVTADNQELNAPMTIDGKEAGTAPATLDLVFERADKSREWSSHGIALGIKDEYKTREFTLTEDGPDTFVVKLDPVTEVGVTPMAPVVVIGPRGAQYVADRNARTAMVDTREPSGTISELRQITSFRRNDHHNPQVNSFAINPNGQSLVYALSETDDDGTVTSNLWQSSTDVSKGARQRLTSGPYLDSLPQLPVCEGENAAQLLVFQSNRGVRESADISSISLADGHVVGGITQVTRESRFNYAPAIVRQSWELFFISTEDHYPQAVPQISYMHVDGSAVSYMNETGSCMTLTPDGRQIFFSRKDSMSGKQQIFSMPREGYPVTQVISQAAFLSANCTYPAISPDGTMMLFVCDLPLEQNSRPNNDIYLMNLSSGQIAPIITNASDDIMPVWSPVEPGVVYFLSNRGGCYNVWRFRLMEAQ